MLDAKLADPQTHKALTLHPLVDAKPRQLPFQLLRDALEAGTMTVGEVGSGTVPGLSVENRGASAVLVLDGEQLIGARQNRMTNRTVLLAAQSTTVIPVSCMEQGRWNFDSPWFHHGDHCSPATLRRVARRTEAAYASAHLAASPEVLAEAQGRVWDEISDYASKIRRRSRTGALNELYGFKALDIEEWSRHFPWVDDQIGLLVFMGDQPLGMDLIGCHRLYARLHKRLVSGYVMDAITIRGVRSPERADPELAGGFMERVRSARRTEAPTVGCGTYRVLTGAVTGGELEEAHRLVHLSAFPGDADLAGEGPPLRRAHRRRR